MPSASSRVEVAGAMPLAAFNPPAPSKKISSKLKPQKVSDPFGASNVRHKTAFSLEHARGSLPVHIHHTGNVMTACWSPPDVVISDADELRFCALAAAGLRETAHPYSLLAQGMFSLLLQRSGVGERSLKPQMDKIVQHLRAGMAEPECFARSVEAAAAVSVAAGPALNAHLPSLLQPLSKAVHSRQHRAAVDAALTKFEQNGGPEASKAIKAKIPTHTPLFAVAAGKQPSKRAPFT